MQPPQPKAEGSMGVLMPMYTIAIIVFFVYTTFKVSSIMLQIWDLFLFLWSGDVQEQGEWRWWGRHAWETKKWWGTLQQLCQAIQQRWQVYNRRMIIHNS